ncbi:hypothetical protein [Gottfriedia solisilvae]|nr:hypothetical protein [Gottfriedia solisilvae]
MDYNQYINELNALITKSKPERMIQFSAIFTEILEKNGVTKPIVVGGLSLEIYTSNNYTTYDIDFVLSGRDKAGEILTNLGFNQSGKDWYHPKLGISVEIPDNSLDGDESKVTKLDVGNRYIYLISIEDILIHRLQSAVATNNQVDREWGFRLLVIYHEDLDIPYIESQLSYYKEQEEFQTWKNNLKLE